MLVWPFTQEGESKCTDLLEVFEKLAVEDDKSVVEFPDLGSSSSESHGGCSSDLQGLRREKLNQFLTVCGKEERVPGQPKKHWEKRSHQRKNVYVTRATTAIVAALEVITPGDAGHLWTAVQSSRGVETALGIDDNIDRKYLDIPTCYKSGHPQAGPGNYGRLGSLS